MSSSEVPAIPEPFISCTRNGRRPIFRQSEQINTSRIALRLNGDSGAFLTGYHCLTHASAYNGAILRYDLGNPVPAPDNRRLERRHLTLEMTMLNDPAVDSQMNLRSSATELFRF